MANTFCVPPPPLPPPVAPIKTEDNDARPGSSSSSRPQSAVSISVADPDMIGRKAYGYLMEDFRSLDADCSDCVVLSCYRPVDVVLQDGPQCGLVALAMAVPFVHPTSDVSVEQVMSWATAHGYTKNGELFSVSYMLDLAREFCTDQASVMDMREDGARGRLLERLAVGNVILVPYDSDRNHSPCLKKGHTAHWAILTGFVCAIPHNNKDALDADERVCADACIPDLYHSTTLTEGATVWLESLSAQTQPILVYSHQGKSRHAGIWSLDALLASNSNLVEVGPERSDDSYVVPTAGIAVELCHKVVIIPNSTSKVVDI